jgi:hypothetical protein
MKRDELKKLAVAEMLALGPFGNVKATLGLKTF